jgi:hypothetical protein
MEAVLPSREYLIFPRVEHLRVLAKTTLHHTGPTISSDRTLNTETGVRASLSKLLYKRFSIIANFTSHFYFPWLSSLVNFKVSKFPKFKKVVMLLPYQSLQKCGNVLVAASGSTIDTFSLDDGSFLSSWTCPVPSTNIITTSTMLTEHPAQSSSLYAQSANAPSIVKPEPGEEPPAKKRRLSDPKVEVEAADPKIEIFKRHHKTKQIPNGTSHPIVISLNSTRDGTHVIAVTGEDKSIRIFDHDGKGRLKQLSQR